MYRSSYSKIENGRREISPGAVDKIAMLFNTTTDKQVHLGDVILNAVSLADKSTVESLL